MQQILSFPPMDIWPRLESRTRGIHWIFLYLLYVNNLPPTLPVILSSQMARSTLIHWEWFWCSSICIFWHRKKFKPCSLSGTQLQKQWIVGCGNLGSFILQALCWSPIYSHHSGIFSNTLLIPSLPLSFFFSFHSFFFFFCALFLPCIPPLKSHWCSGSAPSQAGSQCLSYSVRSTDSVSTQGYLDAFTGRIDSDFPTYLSSLLSINKCYSVAIPKGSTIC